MIQPEYSHHHRKVINQCITELCKQTTVNKRDHKFRRIKPFDAVTPYHDTNGMRPAIAYINLANLKHNFQLLENRSGNSEIMAVVKANAYGHGLDLIAPALFDAGCRHFAVTDAVEGEKARKLLPEAESIVLLSGIFDPGDAKLCSIHHLTPVTTHPYQIELLQKEKFRDSVWIKINTGMQRLGADDPKQLIELCRTQDIKLAGIMLQMKKHTHCAGSGYTGSLCSNSVRHTGSCNIRPDLFWKREPDYGVSTNIGSICRKPFILAGHRNLMS